MALGVHVIRLPLNPRMPHTEAVGIVGVALYQLASENKSAHFLGPTRCCLRIKEGRVRSQSKLGANTRCELVAHLTFFSNYTFCKISEDRFLTETQSAGTAAVKIVTGTCHTV